MRPIALLELYTDVEEIRRNPQKRPIKNPYQKPQAKPRYGANVGLLYQF